MNAQRISLIALLLSTQTAWGMTLKAEIHGRNIEWDQVQQLESHLFTPSFWHVVNGLRPTSEWVPGGLVSASPTEVVLTSGGTRVNVPIEIAGYEYNTGSANPTLGQSQSGLLCSGHYTGGIVQVKGAAQCLFTNSLTTSTAYNLYSFIRPLVKLDTNQLLKALEGNPAGRYVGSVAVGSFYDFYQSGIRSRYHDNYQIRFEFDYEPSFVFEVDVVGDSELTPEYGLGNGLVSGETTFDVRASGWFTDGVTMSLSRSRVDYQMTGPGQTILPYSIECLECDKPILVKDGSVQNGSSTAPGSQTNEIPFRLRVSFDDVELSTLENGRYSDTFYLLFEPGV
ncbi:hypothetical protein [Vibrio parahaemolyticus]|uniref:hypothetical protein n=1 Tax=Vibrio parahaemolyticus TaxID=670 RepID=UPI000A36C179|nr:hypothetical protein [Vibrio parahaemolyticus]OTW00268.1 hypothetical protein BA740_23845 [Vibrio parahaemolyticus]